MSSDAISAFSWSENNERSYADQYIKTTQILREHGIYEELGAYLALSTTMLKARHGQPAERPIVHIDLGCGVGDALAEMSNSLKLNGKTVPHILIGVDVNQHMCRAGVKNILGRGLLVEEHIQHERKAERKGKTIRLKKKFPVNQKQLGEMNLTPDERIVILQDDIRSGTVLTALLQELNERHGISHVDSVSFSQPGLSGDAVNNGKTVQEILLFADNKDVREPIGAEYLHRLIDAVSQKAKTLLGKGGAFTAVNRLSNNEKLHKVYKKMLGKDFPPDDDERGQMFARMLVASVLLGKSSIDFRPSMGSILYPNYQDVEGKTPIEYSTFSPRGGNLGKDFGTYDLFALTSMRSDLHPMGESTRLHSLSVQKEEK